MALPANYFAQDQANGGISPAQRDAETVRVGAVRLQALIAEIQEARSPSGVVNYTADQKTELRTAFNAALTNLKDAARALPTP